MMEYGARLHGGNGLEERMISDDFAAPASLPPNNDAEMHGVALLPLHKICVTDE
jgi:hypothetical protein